MTPVLIAAVVLVGFLCAVDLILTLGVIKRLREHTAMLTMTDVPPPAIAVGTEVGEFSTRTVSDEPLTRELLMSGETLIGIFSVSCAPCREKLPRFIDYTRKQGFHDRVIAAVIGDRQAAVAFADDLVSVADVVIEDRDGPLSMAFQVSSYPTVLTVEPAPDGRLLVKSNDIDLTSPAITTA